MCNQSRSFGRNRLGLCSLDDLRTQLAQNPGRRGIRKARSALELVRVGADSAPETKLRLALGRGGLPEPGLSFVVCDPTGWQLAWPDLAYPQFKLAVNYDGGHHLTAEQKESDIRREESLAALGWISVTVTAAHVKAWGFDGVVPRVRDALVRRGWRGEGWHLGVMNRLKCRDLAPRRRNAYCAYGVAAGLLRLPEVSAYGEGGGRP